MFFKRSPVYVNEFQALGSFEVNQIFRFKFSNNSLKVGYADLIKIDFARYNSI